MSVSNEVPAEVPSVTQSSLPCVPLSALNSSRPPNAVIAVIYELPAAPGLMSFNRDVPVALPSVTQSSEPSAEVRAVNTAPVPSGRKKVG